MAATFFASLVSADGPANYAGFMTRMSATLERIARIAVDKDEKRARSTDDQDEENDLPGSKRHTSRITPTPHSKLRHQRRGSTTRPAANPTADDTHPHQSAAPLPSSIASITARTYALDNSIPEAIEGFPPVNSLGYVVPMSPDDTTNTQSLQPQLSGISTNPTGLGLNDLNGANIALLNDFRPTINTIPSWQLAEDHSKTTTSPLENTQSPYSATSSNGPGPGAATMFPDSWQVPLTADWQFGDDLWAGLFRTETGSFAPQNTSMPILNAESFLNGPNVPGSESQNIPMNGNTGNSYLGYGTQTMGYNFMPTAPAQGQDQSEAQNGDQNQAQDGDYAQSIFSNAFMGMFS